MKERDYRTIKNILAEYGSTPGPASYGTSSGSDVKRMKTLFGPSDGSSGNPAMAAAATNQQSIKKISKPTNSPNQAPTTTAATAKKDDSIVNKDGDTFIVTEPMGQGEDRGHVTAINPETGEAVSLSPADRIQIAKPVKEASKFDQAISLLEQMWLTMHSTGKSTYVNKKKFQTSLSEFISKAKRANLTETDTYKRAQVLSSQCKASVLEMFFALPLTEQIDRSDQLLKLVDSARNPIV